MLYQISQISLADYQKMLLREGPDYLKQLLINTGISSEHLSFALGQVKQALQNTVSDPRAHWILNPGHQAAVAEYPISVILDGKIHHLVIDRSFIENNIRWIIDYKTVNSKADDTLVLKQEISKHQQQLERYALAFRLQEQRPIRLGLYFPLQKLWYEWGFE